MSRPLVTFLMPLHNNATTVRETVASVLAQESVDLEFVVIDDASSDGSGAIVRAFGDPRVRVMRNERRMEIAGTLNRGLALARGEFVARIDADDLCLPTRAWRQLQHFQQHPELAIVGASVQTFSRAGEGEVWRYPADAARTAAGLLFRCTLAHPAVMFRRHAFLEKRLAYDPQFRRAQDYDLWFRCHQAGLKMASVEEVLVRYRQHGGQATRRENDASVAAAATVRRRIVGVLGIAATDEELTLHEALSLNQLCPDAEFLRRAVPWLERLAAANEFSRVFDHASFLRTLTGRYVALKRAGGEISALFEEYVEPHAR